MEGDPAPRRGGRLLTVLTVSALVAVPAGVALAADSGGGGNTSSSGVDGTSVQQRDRGDGDRGERDRGDCPKDRQGQDQQETTEL